jgi:hypothetical protein
VCSNASPSFTHQPRSIHNVCIIEVHYFSDATRYASHFDRASSLTYINSQALARIDNNRAGQLAWQNADNAALYVTAKYVQQANSNEYPHLPEHGAIPDKTRRPTLVGEILFVNDDDTVTELDPAYLDSIDAMAPELIRPLDTDDTISITEGVFSTDDYPAEYLVQRLEWARQQLPGLLPFAGASQGRPVAGGKDLRILTVGDSVTVGYLSNKDGGDGNGYRLKLRDDLPCTPPQANLGSSVLTCLDQITMWSMLVLLQ